jgi:hypothetical protein
MGAHDDQAARFDLVQPLPDEVSKPASHLVSHHRVADTSADHETDLGRAVRLGAGYGTGRRGGS